MHARTMPKALHRFMGVGGALCGPLGTKTPTIAAPRAACRGVGTTAGVCAQRVSGALDADVFLYNGDMTRTNRRVEADCNKSESAANGVSFCYSRLFSTAARLAGSSGSTSLSRGSISTRS
jgi:hypothetical protein